VDGWVPVPSPFLFQSLTCSASESLERKLKAAEEELGETRTVTMRLQRHLGAARSVAEALGKEARCREERMKSQSKALVNASVELKNLRQVAHSRIQRH
jgi:hypothetical protein